MHTAPPTFQDPGSADGGYRVFQLVFLRALLVAAAGVSALFVLADLMGNQIPAAVDALGGFLGAHRAGKIRMLAVTGPRRAASVPEVPTFGELGFNALGSSSWVGLFAPPGTSQALVDRVSAAVAEIAALPSTTASLANVGFDPAAGNPQQLREAVRGELALWQPIIRESGFQID